MMKLAAYLAIDDILPSLAARTKAEALAELAKGLVDRHAELAPADVLQVLSEREQLGSTGIGDGIAIPHGKLRTAKEVRMLFARSRAGIDFGALDGRPVQLFFVVVAPPQAAGQHLQVLARISRVLKEAAVRDQLLAAPDAATLHAIIMEQDAQF